MEWNFPAVFEHLGFLMAGVVVTVQVSLLSMVIAIFLGLVIALVRMAPVTVLRVVASVYIDIFRSTPLLAQLVWVYFAFPILSGIRVTPFAACTIALSLYASAYLAEIYRAGILSIASGQRHAGMALGMTPAQVMWRVVLPQAVTTSPTYRDRGSSFSNSAISPALSAISWGCRPRPTRTNSLTSAS